MFHSPNYIERAATNMLYSASAVTFVGLLYQLVLSFFIVVCIGILENYKLLTMCCADDWIYCTSTIRLRTAAIDAFAHRFEDGHLLHRLFLRLCKSPLLYPPHFRYSYIQQQLFYSLLSLAFQLDVSRKFGHSGFLIFWMLNYCGILAVYVLPLSFSHDMCLII